MNGRLIRCCPLPVRDILEGCRKILGEGYGVDNLRPLIDNVLDQFFFLPDSNELRNAATLLGSTIQESNDVDHYLTHELVGRIQRSFGVIYPNRSYDWVFQPDLNEIIIREFSEPSELPAAPYLTNEEPLHDICDDWIPERLRPR